MEPLMSYDGFMMLQDDRQSRDLLSDYFKEKGYTIVSAEPHERNDIPKADAAQAAQQGEKVHHV